MIGRLLRRVPAIWHGKWYRYLDRVVQVSSLAALPARIPNHDVYLVWADHAPQWLAFTCPCPCKRRLLLPLSQTRYPHWTATTDNGLISVWPSVDATECEAHFFVRKGSIDWV